MMKDFIYIVFLVIFCQHLIWGQEHPLPLQIKSVNASFLEEILSEDEFEISIYNESIPKVIGIRYELIIDFKVDDSTFIKRPSFKIFMSNWDNDISWIDVDSSMINKTDGDIISVVFEIEAIDPGWVYLYCFPSSFVYDYHYWSIWDLKRGTDIQTVVYLR